MVVYETLGIFQHSVEGERKGAWWWSEADDVGENKLVHKASGRHAKLENS